PDVDLAVHRRGIGVGAPVNVGNLRAGSPGVGRDIVDVGRTHGHIEIITADDVELAVEYGAGGRLDRGGQWRAEAPGVAGQVIDLQGAGDGRAAQEAA